MPISDMTKSRFSKKLKCLDFRFQNPITHVLNFKIQICTSHIKCRFVKFRNQIQNLKSGDTVNHTFWISDSRIRIFELWQMLIFLITSVYLKSICAKSTQFYKFRTLNMGRTRIKFLWRTLMFSVRYTQRMYIDCAIKCHIIWGRLRLFGEKFALLSTFLILTKTYDLQ